MANQDKKMIIACIKSEATQLFKDVKCDHPMDKDVINILNDLGQKIKESDDDFEIFKYRATTDRLWGLLLEKSIKCLRYYDTREPFRGTDVKKPMAYGLKDLQKYYNQYTEFERVLYGAGRYYRDHVIHAFRTWLSGMELMVRNGGKTLDNISIHDKEIKIKLERVEKISIWTIVALTHDLGYPLQKAKNVISITQNMLSSFISNPDITADFAFHGVQNYMNDFVVRLMSSKMERRDSKNFLTSEGGADAVQSVTEKPYVARLQPKYYFKFQKSLERNSHGILSTLIIYKLLTYFLESDYSINEDYRFSEEECRQFYIRREILRAIASHTCNDIYQMYMGSFSFLLRICDDTQEWGRKNISELYVTSPKEYELEALDLKFGAPNKQNKCEISEQVKGLDRDGAIEFICQFHHQAKEYVTLFRDGQDTVLRDFSFSRYLTIKVNNVTIQMKLDINRDVASTLNVDLIMHSNMTENEPFGSEFAEEISKRTGLNCEYLILDESGNDAHEKPADDWRSAKLDIPLID